MDDNVINVGDIIRRIKEVKGFKSDRQVADYLGVSKATVSNWTSRNSIDFPLVINKLADVDLNWLLTGRGTPAHRANHVDSGLADGEVQLLHTPRASEALNDRSVPLYDVTAAANLRTLFTNKHQFVLGQIIIPNVPSCDGAVYVSGDSMYPLLKSGDIVGYKEIHSLDNIIYGDVPRRLRPRRRRIPHGEIRQPFRTGRQHQARQLQPVPLAAGHPPDEHHGDGHREILHPAQHDALSTGAKIILYQTLANAVENRIFATCGKKNSEDTSSTYPSIY